MGFRDYSTSAASNTSISGINTDEGMARADVNNVLRQLAADGKALSQSVTRSVFEYGAVGDGVTDDTASFQNAIDAGEGIVFIPAGSYVVGDLQLKSGVFLKGDSGAPGYLPSSVFTSKLIGKTGASWVIDTPVAQQLSCGVANLEISGPGAGPVMGGVRIRDGKWCRVLDNNINNFGEQGILHTSGIAPWVAGNFVLNCVLNRTRAAKTGAIEVGSGTADHLIHDNEATCSVSGAVTSASLYCCAIVVAGNNGFVRDNVGEISDVGIHVSGDYNRCVGNRADNNRAHGWEIASTAGGNQFAACEANENGLAAANTYDNWIIDGNNSSFTNCLSVTAGGTTVRYGFNDSLNSDSGKNIYDATCRHIGSVGTSSWNTSNSSGSARIVPTGPAKLFTSLDTTPSVLEYGTFRTSNGGATSITTFVDAVNGQIITVQCGDANTTLVHNAGLLTTTTGINKLLKSGFIYQFQKFGEVWREIGERSYTATATVDPGSLALGASSTAATITVTGAVMGDFVSASFSNSLAGIVIHAWVSAADTVSYYFTNQNGTNPLDLASGTLTVRVEPK